MCQTWNINGKEIDSQAELIALLGREYLIGEPCYNGAGLGNLNVCLCPIDADAVAEKLGCTITFDNDMIGGDGGGTLYFKPIGEKYA